jgi:protein O-mannosyl-transferase
MKDKLLGEKDKMTQKSIAISGAGGEFWKRYGTFVICVILVVSTLTVYHRVLNYGFVNYDDSDYVVKNKQVRSGLSCEGIVWAFTTGEAGNWHPLTWLSLMLDSQLFGNNIGGFHITSVLLHTINALLLFLVFKKMTGAMWRSAFVAAVFALHPLHVESVAWISERKDVLSGLFWILTIWSYLHYVRKGGVQWYVLTLIIFALGLMSKPMVVTLPLVLLLLDYWPLGRFEVSWNRRIILEKVPFFILSAVSSVVTFFVQKSGGYVATKEHVPLMARVINVPISYIEYIEKMLWPSGLAAFYPHPLYHVSVWKCVTATLVLLVIFVWAIKLVRSHKYVSVGWLWYVGTLVPVIGLIQVGDQALADRYTYIPLTGLLLIIAWGLPELIIKRPNRQIVLGAAMPAVLVILAVCTYIQTGYWRNSIALFEHALKVTKDNYEAHFCLAKPYEDAGRIDISIQHLSEAVRIRPDYNMARNALGAYLLEKGSTMEAISQFNKTLQINPNFADAHSNLCVAYNRAGMLEKAIEHGKMAVKLAPNKAEAYFNLGIALYRKGEIDEAVACWRQAVRLDPADAKTQTNLGAALYQQGRVDEAIEHLKEAVRLNPKDTLAQENLQKIMSARGKTGGMFQSP